MSSIASNSSPQPTEVAPPSPATAHDLGNTDETLELLRRWFSEFGDVFRVYSPARGSWTWVVSDPDAVKRVLVNNHRNYSKGIGIDRVRLLLGKGIMTSEGELWRRQRRMMQPAFHRRVIERLAAIVIDENEAIAVEWDQAARSARRVNVTGSMSRLALRVILRAIFGDDLPRLEIELPGNPLMAVTLESKRDPRFAYEFRQLGRHVAALVDERTCCGRPHFDLLQRLVDARDGDTGEPMGRQALLDEVLTLIVAGHETTASALNWTWWLLSQHPAVDARLHEEQLDAGEIGSNGFHGLAQLPCTSRVVSESMRLYPPGWLLTRRSIGPDTLAGYRVPPGTDVLISPFLLHRHPRHWANPDEFDPEHFEAAQVEARHAFAYIPFSAGPRHCIGRNFALYEMMLHLNFALRRFRLWDPEPARPALEARINLRTAGPVHMRIERR